MLIVCGDLTPVIENETSIRQLDLIVKIVVDGVWLGSNWLRVTRLADQQGGVIQRQQELEALAGSLSSRTAGMNRR